MQINTQEKAVERRAITGFLKLRVQGALYRHDARQAVPERPFMFAWGELESDWYRLKPPVNVMVDRGSRVVPRKSAHYVPSRIAPAGAFCGQKISGTCRSFVAWTTIGNNRLPLST